MSKAAPGSMPPLGGFQRFLIHLSGVEPTIFEQYRVPLHERSTYAKLGITLFIPLIFAVFSAGVTMFSVLGRAPEKVTFNAVISLVFGLLWGLIIFIMDIAIMSQMSKWVAGLDGRPRYFPGQRVPLFSKIGNFLAMCYRKPFEMIVPTLRMVAAAILGVVMSHAIVLEIFSSTVDGVVQQERDQKEELALKVLKEKTDSYDKEITRREDEIRDITMGVADIKGAINAQVTISEQTAAQPNATPQDVNEAIKEVLGKDAQGAVLLKDLEDLRSEQLTLQPQVDTLRAKKLELQVKRDEEERRGDPLTQRKAGQGPVWNAINDNLTATSNDLAKIEGRMGELGTALPQAEKKMKERYSAILEGMEKTRRQAVESRQAELEQIFKDKADIRKAENEKRVGSLRAQIKQYDDLRQRATQGHDASLARQRQDSTNQSYGILERTMALHKLIFDPGSLVPKTGKNEPAAQAPAAGEPGTVLTAVGAPAAAGAGAAAAAPAGTPPAAVAPPPQQPSAAEMELKTMEAEALKSRAETLEYSWLAVLLVFFILDTLPVFVKFIRRVSCVDILMQQLHNKFRHTPIEELEVGSRLDEAMRGGWGPSYSNGRDQKQEEGEEQPPHFSEPPPRDAFDRFSGSN